jgi:hypothetical protein
VELERTRVDVSITSCALMGFILVDFLFLSWPRAGLTVTTMGLFYCILAYA